MIQKSMFSVVNAGSALSPIETNYSIVIKQCDFITDGNVGWMFASFGIPCQVWVYLRIGCLSNTTPYSAHDFGVENSDVAASITLTLAMRPVGALLFGWLADQYGRKWPLMIDIVLYVQCVNLNARSCTECSIIQVWNFGIGFWVCPKYDAIQCHSVCLWCLVDLAQCAVTQIENSPNQWASTQTHFINQSSALFGIAMVRTCWWLSRHQAT